VAEMLDIDDERKIKGDANNGRVGYCHHKPFLKGGSETGEGVSSLQYIPTFHATSWNLDWCGL
jgi:hypothetical protein